MPKHVAFLRGINVGGNTMLAMGDIKRLFGEMGYAGVTTLLQSGNVLLDLPARERLAALEDRLQQETGKRHTIAPEYFLRSAAEIRAMLDANPFTQQAQNDPSHLVVLFLKDKPSSANLGSLKEAIRGSEEIAAGVRELYLYYPDGIGRSKLTNGVIEKHLGQRGTGRNWNTLVKLAALLSITLRDQ